MCCNAADTTWNNCCVVWKCVPQVFSWANIRTIYNIFYRFWVLKNFQKVNWKRSSRGFINSPSSKNAPNSGRSCNVLSRSLAAFVLLQFIFYACCSMFLAVMRQGEKNGKFVEPDPEFNTFKGINPICKHNFIDFFCHFMVFSIRSMEWFSFGRRDFRRVMQ